MQKLSRLFSEAAENSARQFGLLVLRVSVGLVMLLSHGWGKLMSFSERAAEFADPFGLGSTISFSLTVFAEVFCSIALILGLFTRLATIPLIVTMLTAIFIIHGDDPWNKQELAMMFLIPYITIFLAGPGKYSVDDKLAK